MVADAGRDSSGTVRRRARIGIFFFKYQSQKVGEAKDPTNPAAWVSLDVDWLHKGPERTIEVE